MTRAVTWISVIVQISSEPRNSSQPCMFRFRRLSGQPPSQWVNSQNMSSQTTAPVAASDRVDLAESYAWVSPR